MPLLYDVVCVLLGLILGIFLLGICFPRLVCKKNQSRWRLVKIYLVFFAILVLGVRLVFLLELFESVETQFIYTSPMDKKTLLSNVDDFSQYVEEWKTIVLRIRWAIRKQFKASIAQGNNINSFLQGIKYQKRGHLNNQSYIMWIRATKQRIHKIQVKTELQELKWNLISVLAELDILFVSCLQQLQDVPYRIPVERISKTLDYKLKQLNKN